MKGPAEASTSSLRRVRSPLLEPVAHDARQIVSVQLDHPDLMERRSHELRFGRYQDALDAVPLVVERDGFAPFASLATDQPYGVIESKEQVDRWRVDLRRQRAGEIAKLLGDARRKSGLSVSQPSGNPVEGAVACRGRDHWAVRRIVAREHSVATDVAHKDM